MKILAVHQGGGVGGAPVSLLKLLSALEPSVFTSQAVFTEAGPILDYARELHVASEVVPTGGAFYYSAHADLRPRMLAQFVRTFPSAVQMAQRVLEQQRPDVLHLNTSVLLAWAAAARRVHVPVVWMVREVLGPNPTLRTWHAGYIRRHARAVVAISGAVRACFPADAPVVVVHNAVDLDEFRLELRAERPTIRDELRLPREAPIVMVLGSVQRVKGHWLLLDAISQMQVNAHVALVCGGVPPGYASSLRGRVKRGLGRPMDALEALQREAHRRGLAQRIHTTGFRRDVSRVLAAADVLAFPSLRPEGFGRPIIEAMAMACPVVATSIGPSAELLGPEAGQLVPPEPQALAHALDELLGSADLRTRMGQAGRRRAEACFSLDRQVAAMQAIYRGVAAHVA